MSGDYHLACEGPWMDEWWSRSIKPQISRIELDEKLSLERQSTKQRHPSIVRMRLHG